MKKTIVLLTYALTLGACYQKTAEPEEKKREEIQSVSDKERTGKDKAKEWLESIFKCKDTTTFCYYLDKEDTICTKRYMEFLVDSNEIYGASNLTEKEVPEAERKYKEKWSKIYPLYSGETWLFGRGNDDSETIRDVKIDKMSHLKYQVYIDYGNGTRTQNEVTLVLENTGYKIDYCKTDYLP